MIRDAGAKPRANKQCLFADDSIAFVSGPKCRSDRRRSWPVEAERFDGNGELLAEQQLLHHQAGAWRELQAGAEMAGSDEQIDTAWHLTKEWQTIGASRPQTRPAAF